MNCINLGVRANRKVLVFTVYKCLHGATSEMRKLLCQRFRLKAASEMRMFYCRQLSLKKGFVFCVTFANFADLDNFFVKHGATSFLVFIKKIKKGFRMSDDANMFFAQGLLAQTKLFPLVSSKRRNILPFLRLFTWFTFFN